MSGWRSLHAFTPAVEPLLLEVVGPFLARHDEELDHGFWERHYAGGPHLRIRLRSGAERLDALTARLRGAIEEWFAAHPAEPAAAYSEQRAAALLRQEGIDPETEDLRFRHHEVVERTYPEPGKPFASVGARRLAENFRRRSGPLALAILQSERPRRDEALRLFLVLGLNVGSGRYPPGCVSYKSHWEGFAATSPLEAVLQRIRDSYAANRDHLASLLREVEAGWTTRFAGDRVLEVWWRVLAATSREATELFERGEELVEHPQTPAAAAEIRARLYGEHVRRSSEFMDILWRDERFLALIRHDVRFHRPRVLVNLLYDLLASLGMSPIEKMALCHHTFRAVEEAHGCDLNDKLRENVAALLERQTFRLDERDAEDEAAGVHRV